MDLEIATSELGRTRLVDAPAAALAPGGARLRVDRFGLTSNNVSYGVTGDLLGYWTFFPASTDDGDGTRWGRVPVWGFAEVIESRSDDLVEGERLFGYLPMSDELVIEVGSPRPQSVDDVAPHRAALAGPYNAYQRCAADPLYRANREDVHLLLYPLFFTSFLIDDFLEANGDDGAEQVVVSSASSKTAAGVGHQLRARGQKAVGLTSSRNAAFCRSLGAWDEVVEYGDVEGLAVVPSVFVDVAGDPAVVHAVHARLGDDLRRSMIVGDTHWDANERAAGGLSGPKPEFFFAPSQVSARNREWGPEELGRRLGAAWETYADWVASWLNIETVLGLDEVAGAWRGLVVGPVDPRVGTVCVLDDGAAR